jgi:hypothetical protein
MSLNFLSGLLLVVVALGAVAYVVYELFGDRLRERWNEREGRNDETAGATPRAGTGAAVGLARSLARLIEKHVGADAKPVNTHLVGAVGKVIAHSDNDERPMRVRLGIELWPARSAAASEAQARLPLGTAVEVRRVEGPVVLVTAREESPQGG